MISKATTTDATALVQLINSAYRGEGSKQGWTTEADLLDGTRTDEDSIKELIQKPNSTILKFTSGEGFLQGCVYLKKQDNELYLGMLTVAPNLQNGGIGKQLLRAAEVYAIEQNCAAISMTVISVRNELIEWYERKGYRNTGITKPFPSNDPRFGIPKQPLQFVVLKKEIV